MKYFLYKILDNADPFKVQNELAKKGLENSFIMEDELTGETFLGGYGKKAISSKKVLLIEEKDAVIDWEEQWATYAQGFKEGKAHIPVGDKTLLLWPGPGFGDLSHPTTSLMLDLLEKYVAQESVLDIGTGSGILALAALLLGAKSAIGIDLDPKALLHARKNAKLNHLKAKFSKRLPKKLNRKNIVLMNMIFSEQIEFAPSQLNSIAKFWITSGILKKQRRSYLQLTKEWGWKKIGEKEKKGWLGFVFKLKDVDSTDLRNCF